MSSFSVNVDDEQVRAALQRLRGRAENLSPLMQRIGELLVESTQDRFSTATAPDGSAWAPNTETTITRYLGLTRGNHKKDGSLSKKGAARGAAKKPLTGETGELRRQIHYRVIGNSLEVGSSMEYAAVQQFGRKKGESGSDRRGRPIPWGDIPARPFIGLSDDDKSGIEQSISDYLRL